MGTCTTSIECKTVMTVMLTVMSVTDPQMVRVTQIGLVGMLGFGQSELLGRATIVDSVVCSMSRFEEKSFWH
jgi:hypothetical protein